MGAQPTGTITLLFSDIEGSTRLLHVLGADRYARVLERHRIILRDAFGRHGGYEVDCEGDAFFVAFSSAAGAVAAASEGQLRLAAESWPEGVELRVRIGLHTGEPLVAAPKYVGVDVHRAARIMAAGHGGQVLLSQSTRDLLGPDLAVRDLGEQRLKDLLQPERVYQLQLAGSASEFPPLRSLNATNLPVASWPLVGRRQELAEIGELLRDGARLVTLTGPGGSGKTRLALQVAAESVDDFPDGVFFVGLAPLRSAELVPGEIVDALGIGPTSEPLERLHEHLAERQMLLVLDNAEHLPGLAPILARFSETRRLRLLVTSRRPLHLSWERAYRVDPLPEQDAIEFFVQRARAVRRDFAADTALPELCRRLDGLPLALELAAARVKLLSPQAILNRLDTVLPFLSAGPQDLPERQRTLRATIEWSHDLLNEAERAAFRRLSVFPGTYALGAAEAVADTDLELLAALVDHSLLKPVGNDRLLMLETLHEYAAELLRESGEADELARRHAAYFTEIAESALAEPFVPDAATWLARLEADLDNFRAALASARDSGDCELFLRLAAPVGRCFWIQRGDLHEGRDWLEQALAASETPEEARIVALSALASISYDLGDTDAATRYAQATLELARARGDLMGIFHGLIFLSVHAQERGELDQARSLVEESADYARRAGSDWAMAFAAGVLGAILLERREFDQALEPLTEAARLADQAGDKHQQAMWLGNAATAALRLGRVELAADLIRDVIHIEVEMPSSSLLLETFTLVAAMAAAMNRPEPAARLLGAAHRIADETGYRQHMIDAEQAEATLQQVRAALGDQADTAIAVGRAMTLNDAVADALNAISS